MEKKNTTLKSPIRLHCVCVCVWIAFYLYGCCCCCRTRHSYCRRRTAYKAASRWIVTAKKRRRRRRSGWLPGSKESRSPPKACPGKTVFIIIIIIFCTVHVKASRVVIFNYSIVIISLSSLWSAWCMAIIVIVLNARARIHAYARACSRENRDF